MSWRSPRVIVVLALATLCTFGIVAKAMSPRGGSYMKWQDPDSETVSVISARIDQYHSETGTLPLSLEDLFTHRRRTDGKAFLEIHPVDSWGHQFGYQAHGGHFTLRSDGPDGIRGTPDDLIWNQP